MGSKSALFSLIKALFLPSILFGFFNSHTHELQFWAFSKLKFLDLCTLFISKISFLQLFLWIWKCNYRTLTTPSRASIWFAFAQSFFLHPKYSLPALLSEKANSLIYLPQLCIILCSISFCLMEKIKPK